VKKSDATKPPPAGAVRLRVDSGGEGGPAGPAAAAGGGHAEGKTGGRDSRGLEHDDPTRVRTST
jgi:hypothetical protein